LFSSCFVAAVAAAAPCAPGPALAQSATASLSAGAVAVRYENAPAASAFTLSPAVIVRTPGAYLALFGSVAQLEGRGLSPQGTFAVATFSPATSAGVLGEVGFSIGGTSHPDGASTGQGGANARVHWRRESVGAWVGAGVGTTWAAERWRSFRSYEVGGVFQREATVFTLRASPTRTADGLRSTDYTMALDGAVGAVDLTATFGTRTGAPLPVAGGDRRTWGGISAALWFARRAAVVASGGTYPVDLTQGFPAGRYVSLALRVGGWRAVQLADAATARSVRREALAAGITGVEVQPLAPGRVALRVRAPRAARVELMGDLTGWASRSLRRSADGWWTIVLDASGATELVVRVDGGPWTVPPGATVATDEFGGRVGRFFLP
jgi:hypothetical protein